MLGSVILALNVSWIPDLVKGIFEPTGTELVFSAIGAVIALWQFVKSRTGEGQPAQLSEGKSSIIYALNPFGKAS